MVEDGQQKMNELPRYLDNEMVMSSATRRKKKR